jgi:hypothetical protein
MRLRTIVAAGAAALALGLASGALAQETSGAMHGLVTGANGKPLDGAMVTITHVPSGTAVTTTTNKDGVYDAQNLRTGGPYTVTVISGYNSKTLRIDDVEAGPPYNLDVSLQAPANEIIVTGTQAKAAQLQTGPRTIVSARDIQTLPSFSRDLRDLVRLNPFVTLDPTNSNAMIVAGSNNRFNTIYVDGVKQADDFGLNANGYPTQRSPISLGAIQSTDFEIAPEDVQYGSFQGAIMNIVTKSGTNTIHGSGYVEYDDNNMAGSTVQGRPVAKFRDVTYGATLGGPIIKDRLFVFGGYEKYKGFGANSAIYGPTGSNAPNLVSGITQADVDNVRNILKSVYNFDPLNWSDVGGEQTDTKWFGKVDFNITDRHRAVFEYQRTDGATTFSGGGSGTSNSTSTTAPVLELGSHWYNLDQKLTAYTGELFSHWTDNFSTDLFYTHKQVDQVRAPLAGNSFAEFDITLPDNAKIIAGPDISSHGNVLTNTDQLFKYRAHLNLGDHHLTAGYEREWLDVFNEFVQQGNGQYVFNGTCGAGNGLTNLQNKVACQLGYANAPTNVKADAAARWADVVNTFYVQDEWRPIPELTIRVGLRDELYDQPGAPAFNPRFTSQYGFSNTHTLNGKFVLMPRFGFNWQPDPTIIVSGGVGLYSGGTPNVWISNDYSNTGNLIGAVVCKPAPAGPCANSLQNIDGFNVGADAKAANTASAVTNNGIVNALDPKFKPPSTWKFSLHAQKYFDLPWVGGASNPWIGSGWNVHGDFIYTRVQDAISYVDLLAASAPLSPAPDGRPRFSASRYTAARTTGYDLLLTDTTKGGGAVWAVGLGKDWNDGWLDGLNFDFTYTGERIKDVNPGTSSVAASNYGTFAVSDPNNPGLAISNYNIRWQFKLTAGYRHAFIGNYFTNVQLYAQRRAGLPFSYTFTSAAGSTTQADQMFGESGTFASRSRQLLYVPKADSTGAVTATSDPIVTYGSSFDVAKFNAFLQSSGLIKYAGKITPRNQFTSRPQTTADMRISQEIPGFFPHGAKGRFYLDIIDLPNLLNSNWGQVQQISFPYFYSLISATNCQNPGAGCLHGTGNFYQYNAQNTRTPSTTDRFSVWQMKVGFEFDF